MAGFIVFNKFSVDEAIQNMLQAEAWFRANPKRKEARTDLFVIRRGYVVEDVLRRTQWTAPGGS